MINYQIKIITGFRKDQEYTIGIEEAHKAYFLFINPEKKAIFSNGLALKGKDIDKIVPDYHATMGWNKAHNLTEFDFQELKSLGVENKLRDLMLEAKTVAIQSKDEKLFGVTLTQAKQLLLK